MYKPIAMQHLRPYAEYAAPKKSAENNEGAKAKIIPVEITFFSFPSSSESIKNLNTRQQPAQ